MLAHHREWHAYAKDVLGLGIKREELVLAIGWVKTSADWKVIAFTRSSASYHASLEGRAFGVAGAELRRKRAHELEPPKMHREGALYGSGAHRQHSSSGKAKPPSTPSAPAASSILDERADPSGAVHTADSRGPAQTMASPRSGEPQKDQCIFLRRCMTKWRVLFTSIVAEAGPHQLPRQEDRRRGQGGERLVARQEDEEDNEPGDGLLSYANEVRTKP